MVNFIHKYFQRSNSVLTKMLVSEKELNDNNFERLKKSIDIHKKNIFDSNNNMYLTVNLLIDISNIITVLNNITLRKGIAKPYGYDKTYMDKNLMEDKLYELIDQFHERKTNCRDFYFAFLGNIHPFYDGNGKTCKILFVTGKKV